MGAAAVRNQILDKRKSADFLDASSNLAPDRESEQTVDIIIPNTIHGCKKKNLYPQGSAGGSVRKGKGKNRIRQEKLKGWPGAGGQPFL